MIIYICSSEENRNLLDRMAELYEWELLTEVFHSAGSVSEYVSEKLQIISGLEYMVIERAGMAEDEEGLLELVETIQYMFETKFIILEEQELIDDEGEQKKVIYGEHYTSLHKCQETIEEDLEYLLTGQQIPEEIKIEGTWIGVMTASSGAGATDFSIGIANYIHRYDESVSYVEANESDDLEAMAEYYGFHKEDENLYRRDGVDYRHQSVDPEKHFTVLDLGKYNATKLTLLNQCKIKILISDVKPYRMQNALQILQHMGDDTKLCLNFGTQEDFDRIQETYLQKMENIYRVDYHRDMFCSEDQLYKELLQDYIETTQAESSWKKKTAALRPERIKSAFMRDRKGKADTDRKEAEETDEHQEIEEAITYEAEAPPEEIMEVMPEPGQPVNDNLEEYIISDLKEPDKKKDIKTKTHKKRKSIKSNLILLLFGIALAMEAAALWPEIKENWNETEERFLFNNPDTEEYTAIIDKDLNINEDIKISVLEVEGADGYEVSYSTDREFPEERTVVVEVETADKAVESLSAGKTYYVRVRAFKFNEDGTKVYGEYTEVQEIET